jgi:signal transduction histidine kinase
VEVPLSRENRPYLGRRRKRARATRPRDRRGAIDEASAARIQESLTLAASRAQDPGRALAAILRRLCSTFDWSYGEAWVPSRDGTVLKPGPAWPRAAERFRGFRHASRRLGFLPGAGLPGVVWESREPLLVRNVATDCPATFSRHTVAIETGFRGALGVPVLSGEDVVAVLILFRLDTIPEEEDPVPALTSAVVPLGSVLAAKQVEVELAARERQQRAVARLGLRALGESTDLEILMSEAVSIAAATLEVEHGMIAEYRPDRNSLFLRAGMGWRRGVVGQVEVPGGPGSQAGFTLTSMEPVIVQDLEKETRFRASSLLREHAVVSGLSVVIHGRLSPFGVLAVHGQQRRSFTPDDVHFLQAVANVLGTALERKRAEDALAAHRRELETLVERRTAELETSHERLRIAERLASIGTLAAGLGHDLGNTILPLLCRLDALEAAPLSSAALEELGAVRRAVEYLRELSQGLRLLALDPANDSASNRVTVLSDWWRSVRALVRAALPKRIALECDVPEGLPAVAVANHRLSQAVLNLVSNSAEAISGEGTVQVWARLADGDRHARFGVTDDGRGMSPQVRRHSMDPFFTTKKRGLSTGLGLALVHGFAQASGGSVEIESAKDEGTTVVLTLPVHDPGAARPARRELTALVDIRDRRMASYAELLLRSEGLVVLPQRRGDPGNADIWITEPTETALRRARRHLAGDKRRRVVFLGEAPRGRRPTGAVFLDRFDGSDSLRRSLRQVVFRMLEESDDG